MSCGWLVHYLTAEYEDGARGPRKYDCWALAREVRHKHCGKALLPSCGHVRNTMPKEFTRAQQSVTATLEQCNPEDGAVAAVFRGKICIHVAVVISVPEWGLGVLEINQHTGPRIMRVSDFERHYAKIIYYRDRDDHPSLPKQD